MNSALILGGTIAVLVFAIIWLARREGRQAIRASTAEAAVERAQDGLEIDEDIARMSSDELDRELRRQ